MLIILCLLIMPIRPTSYMLVMFVDYSCHVLHATEASLDVVLVEDAVEFVVMGKCFCIRFKKDSATFVWRFLLYGGLNHMIFLFLSLLFGAFVFWLTNVRVFCGST